MDEAVKNKKYTGRPFSERLIMSLTAGFAIAFTFVFFGAFEIYAGNMEELGFRLSDFVFPLLAIMFGAFAVIGFSPSLAKGKVYDILFALILWIAVMGYAQGNFLNFGLNSLLDDDVGKSMSAVYIVIDVIVWLVTGVGSVLAALFIKNREMYKIVAMILLVMIIGMQLVSGTVTFFSTGVANFDPEVNLDSDSDEECVLTTKNLYSVSKNDNVIIFIIDRFDAKFYDQLIKKEPDFFDDLDGFTYYDDNISLYARTYPGVASIISGTENEFSQKATRYFDKAYHNSKILNDLKNNDYRISVYSDQYYAYRDANELLGIADNVSGVSGGYTVSNRGKLTLNMMLLSLYRYSPIPLKYAYDLSSGSFDGILVYDTEYPIYELYDAGIYEKLKSDGLTADTDMNSYTFLHLNGCHPPYLMDENGDPAEKGTSNAQKTLRGCFMLIKEYIKQLKELGVYDNATIIVTGDHCDPIDDFIKPSEPRMTALFVKEAGQTGKLKYSHAQVSQENMPAEIVKSAGLKTQNDYGKAYSDISEGENTVRYHIFQQTKADTAYDVILVRYKITGAGKDFSNWEIESEKDIGYMYK